MQSRTRPWRPTLTARFALHSRDDIKRLLERTGNPPPLDLPALEQRVWAEIEQGSGLVQLPWWRGWSMAGWMAAAIACGILSAAWRVGALSADGADPHARYLELIDPLVRSAANSRS